MAVLGIDYDGGGRIYDDITNKPIGLESPIVYKTVYLHTQEGKFVFDTGDFIFDWYEANKKFYQEIYEKEAILSYSSSVDHFIFDGAPYGSAYFHVEDGENILKYVDYTDKDWVFTQQHIINGMELFVDENTQPTFNEYISHIFKQRENYVKENNKG